MLKEPKPDDQLLRTHTQEDLAVLGVRISAGVFATALGLGPGGTLIGELLALWIPRQRADRLRDYVEELAAQLSGLEDQFKTRMSESVAFSALVERTIIAAVQQASATKRRDIARLVKTGLSRTDVELEEHETLLRLVERANDSQLIILTFYSLPQTFGNLELDSFLASHREVFPLEPSSQAPAEDQRRWIMHNVYVSELVSMGLLEDVEGNIKSAGPRQVQLTALGSFLLDAIERQADSNQAKES